MRPAVILAAIVMFGGAAIAMSVGGKSLLKTQAASEGGRPTAQEPANADAALAARSKRPAGSKPSQPASGPPRSDASDVVSQSNGEAFERAEPREPLSQLSLALPPKPRNGGGTILYRPVVIGSARFEAMGRIVAVAGTENVASDERCSYGGRDWACGMRARTAFRYFIRGRAVTCALPPDAETEVVADCRIGKQDVGAWLVANGWARAVPDGPYVDVEKKAREAKLGIFGPPPEAVD